MATGLALDHEAIAHVCRAHGVSRLQVFGSATSERFDSENSDVDFLVVLDERGADLFNLMALNQFLDELFKTRVDLGTRKSLRKTIKEQVLREAIRVA